jgi:hypothetical protein
VYFEQGAEIKEAFLKVVHREAHEVVTIIEILRPMTKVPGSPSHFGFEATKREDKHRPLHRVEIDLLRGDRMVPLPIDIGPHEYLVSILRKHGREERALWPIRLFQPLPVIAIPLKTGDPDGRLDLQVALDTAYRRAGYDLRIDYREEPTPPLDEKLAAWADELLRSKGLR